MKSWLKFLEQSRWCLLISDGGWALGSTVPSRAAKAVDSGNGRSFVFVLFRMTSRWPFTTPTVRSTIGRQRKMPASLWHRVQVKPAGKPELGPRYYIDYSLLSNQINSTQTFFIKKWSVVRRTTRTVQRRSVRHSEKRSPLQRRGRRLRPGPQAGRRASMWQYHLWKLDSWNLVRGPRFDFKIEFDCICLIVLPFDWCSVLLHAATESNSDEYFAMADWNAAISSNRNRFRSAADYALTPNWVATLSMAH